MGCRYASRESISSEVEIPLGEAAIQDLRSSGSVVLPDTTLLRRIGLSFWIATLVFIGMLILIAMGKLHNTLASLLGAATILALAT